MDVPDQNARGIAASDLKLEGDQVSLRIPAAGIEYTGQLSGNNIKGTFKQSGASFDLNLARGKYQVPGIDMPAEDMNKLLGQWAGRMKMSQEPNADIATVILRFEKTKDGKLAAFLASDAGDQIYRWNLPVPGESLLVETSNIQKIVTGSRTGILQVPRTALVSWDVAKKQGEVFVVNGDKAQRKVIATGALSGEQVEVSSGIAAGEFVVTRGGFNLKDGNTVKVIAGNGR